MGGDILVANYTSPEMNYCALAVARLGRLLKYVRPYANVEGPIERFLSAMPFFSKVYVKTFGRRVMPKGLEPHLIDQVAVIEDIFKNACCRVKGNIAKAAAENLHWRIQREIGSVAASYAAHARMVFAAYFVAKKAFIETAGLKILNYSIAHHKHIQEFLFEEAQLQPAFAATLPESQVPAWVQKRLDEECALADVILIGSSYAGETFVCQGIPRQKVRIVPYGVDTSVFRPNRPSPGRRDSLRALFVGQIGQRKGISYLLEAAKRLSGKGYRFTLVGNILGDGKPLSPYRDYFMHIPNIPRAQLPMVYNSNDVFVFPTLIEGMGLVVLEAMACGLPVITTRNGPGDIVRDGIDGFIVPIRDVDAVCDCLEILQANPDLRVNMGANARQRASEYSWEAYMACITDLVSEIESRNG
jgi:glycosyltransferase involved in cell wall biosynthesis